MRGKYCYLRVDLGNVIHDLVPCLHELARPFDRTLGHKQGGLGITQCTCPYPRLRSSSMAAVCTAGPPLKGCGSWRIRLTTEPVFRLSLAAMTSPPTCIIVGTGLCLKDEVLPCLRTMTSPATRLSARWRTVSASSNACLAARRWRPRSRGRRWIRSQGYPALSRVHRICGLEGNKLVASINERQNLNV